MAVSLEERRLNLGLSPEQLAEAAGVTKHVVRSAEKSGRRPQPQNAKKIADYFGTTVTEIWPVAERKAAA